MILLELFKIKHASRSNSYGNRVVYIAYNITGLLVKCFFTGISNLECFINLNVWGVSAVVASVWPLQ